MIALRKENEVLCDGAFRVLYEGGRVYAFERVLGDKRLVSVCNMSGKAAKLPRAVRGIGKVLVSSYGEAACDGLMPFEFRLYESEGRE
jgi:hypothetical protein